MTDKTLFEPYTLGRLTLANRFVMAPLTRNRAGAGLVPSELAATYYAQRASAGLIITEATQVSAQAQAIRTPRACTRPGKSPAGARSPRLCMPRGEASLRNSGTSAVFRTSMSSLTALRQSRLRPSARRRRPLSTMVLSMCRSRAPRTQ